MDIGVEGRDKQLVKHSVQLFNGCKCLKEVIETLQKFLNIKNEKKESSIELVLLKVVATLVKFNGPRISSKSIWTELMQEIPGILNEKNPNEYNTDDYGTIYRTTTLSSYLGDVFGGVVKHGNKGNDWVFDPETIQRLTQEDKTRISIKEGEGVNTVNTPGEGGSSELEEITNNNTKDDDDNDDVYPYNESQASQEQESIPDSIHRIHPNSDIWKCDNCALRDDKWGMIRHLCKYNLKHKDNKLGCI